MEECQSHPKKHFSSHTLGPIIYFLSIHYCNSSFICASRLCFHFSRLTLSLWLVPVWWILCASRASCCSGTYFGSREVVWLRVHLRVCWNVSSCFALTITAQSLYVAWLVASMRRVSHLHTNNVLLQISTIEGEGSGMIPPTDRRIDSHPTTPRRSDTQMKVPYNESSRLLSSQNLS